MFSSFSILRGIVGDVRYRRVDRAGLQGGIAVPRMLGFERRRINSRDNNMQMPVVDCARSLHLFAILAQIQRIGAKLLARGLVAQSTL